MVGVVTPLNTVMLETSQDGFFSDPLSDTAFYVPANTDAGILHAGPWFDITLLSGSFNQYISHKYITFLLLQVDFEFEFDQPKW